MKQKILITGITGFAGSHLAEYLASQNQYEIAGTYTSEKNLSQIASIKESLQLFQVNLSDIKAVQEMIGTYKPDRIFHLAALTAPGKSFVNPAETITANIVMQTNILEAVRQQQLLDCKVLVTASAEVYGKVSETDLPIDEDTPLTPTSPYAVSKIAQDYLALQYYLAYGLKVIRVRPFNHIGPRQSADFVVSSFAKQIAEVEKGVKESVIKVGNLKAKRDFTDVRDMVRAYELLIVNGKEGDVYNIGSGRSYAIEEILKKLISYATLKPRIEVDKSLFRPIDVPDAVCDNSKFVALTNWKQMIPIEKSLQDTLEYWRALN